MSDVAFNAPAAPGHYGAAGIGRLALHEVTTKTVWNVQGDPARSHVLDAAQRLFALSLPTAPNTTARIGSLTALWLGPASWLLIDGGSARDATTAVHANTLGDFAQARDTFNAAGGALFDASVARVGWSIAGSHAAIVLAKGCPLDFHERIFMIGSCAQSVFGHVNALFYRNGEREFTMWVARGFARDVWHTLCESAAQYGYDVLAPAVFQSTSRAASSS